MVKLNISVLFDYELLHKIFDKIKYLISKKSGITNSVNYNYGKIKIDSYQKIIKFSVIVITFIKSVVNKNENKHYYNIFLEKGSYIYIYIYIYI